jgi:UDPglucose 6-dehydrogenase
MGLDPRIGPHFLRAGLGFGGFCFPKDIQAFIRLAERAGMDFQLLKEAEAINHHQIDRFIEKVRRALWVIRDKRIGVLGLAFKPNTDDVRFSPALKVVERLVEEGAQVQAFDPQATEKARALVPRANYVAEAYAVAAQADALIIATEWPEFADLDWERIRQQMARPLIIDGRNLLNPREIRALGFEYESVGRPDGDSPGLAS